MIRVWQYWVIRPKAVFFTVQSLLLAIVLLHVISGWPAELAGQRSGSPGLLLILLTCQLCFYLTGVDEVIVQPRLKPLLTSAGKSLVLGVGLAGLMFYLFPFLTPGLTPFAAAVVLSVAVLATVRGLAIVLAGRRRLSEGLLILGTGELAKKFYSELAGNGGARPAGVLAETTDSGEEGDSGIVVRYSDLPELTRRHRISRIVLAEPNTENRQELAVALLDCKLRGLEIEHAVESYERLNGKIWLEALRPEWLIYAEGFQPSRFYLRLKPVLDFTGALLLVLVTLPLLALCAAAIKLTSRGPVLFRQIRVGRHGRHFVLYKFRSMREDAELSTGPTWSGEDDPRITVVGRVLRKFRLDELPQAFNVLRGDMSLVGPRPERPYFVNLLQPRIPYYDLRHYLKPGITGWAQVLYPYGASIEDAYEKLQYDLYYSKHLSLRMDLVVLAKTVGVVLFGRGR